MPSPIGQDSDLATRLALGAVTLLIGWGAWRWFNPSTHFEADGLDPRWDRAVEMSKAAKQPAIVLVTADWCPTCQNLHANVLSRSDVRSELDGHYTFLKLDMTAPTPAAVQHADKLHANSYPTLIRYNRDGNETGREHFLPPDAMLSWLRDGE